MKKWDVIIVGGGPAGSTLGYELGRAGLRTLILEKRGFPRYKACGGGLNIKTLRSLDFDLSPIIEDTIARVRLTFRMGEPFTRSCERPVTAMTSRERLDRFLLQKATEAGCVAQEGERVRSVEIRDRDVCVYGERERHLGGIVVGADGAYSVVAKAAGLMQDALNRVGIESEIEVDDPALEGWRGGVAMDLGSIKDGYGWVFPKRDHLSVGVWGPSSHLRQLKAYYRSFTERWAGQERRRRIIRKRGHHLPVRRKGAPIQNGRVLLIGDAAGLIDPLTGEGIYYAVQSAKIAAKVIKGHLGSPWSCGLAAYQALVDQALMTEMERARRYTAIFCLCPRLCFYALMRSKRLWRVACALLTGDLTYVGVGRVLGPLEFLLDL